MGMTTENTGGGGKKHSKLRRQEAVAGWLFVLPAVIFWLVWFFVPGGKGYLYQLLPVQLRHAGD